MPPGSDWVALGPDALPVDAATAWASVPNAGAVVVFLGIVRDHADGRDGVTALTYEAYETEAARVMARDRRRRRGRAGRTWPGSRCSTGPATLGLGEASVAVVVSSPHRAAAFDAARFCIDTLKETVPIWKQEHHVGGSDWGLGAASVRPLVAEDRG